MNTIGELKEIQKVIQKVMMCVTKNTKKKELQTITKYNILSRYVAKKRNNY